MALKVFDASNCFCRLMRMLMIEVEKLVHCLILEAARALDAASAFDVYLTMRRRFAKMYFPSQLNGLKCGYD